MRLCCRLFDNMPSEAILSVVSKWLLEDGAELALHDADDQVDPFTHTPASSVLSGESPSMQRLAQALVDEAMERSVDRTVDSPFAILAKDNNILWSGGIRDDVTVVTALITRGPWPSGSQEQEQRS
jgi:hypothetical protein